jgi:hypothetical protein
MAAKAAAKNEEAQILGIVDTTTGSDAKIESCRLGEAIQFVANASILGYDVRAAMVFYGTELHSLRRRDCEQLWSKYGETLLRP